MGYAEMALLSSVGWLLPLFSASIFLPVVVYVVARWRSYRENMPDPQLGAKTVIGMFLILSFQVLMAAGTLLLYGVLVERDQEDIIRTAAGLLLPAAVVYAAHFL